MILLIKLSHITFVTSPFFYFSLLAIDVD